MAERRRGASTVHTAVLWDVLQTVLSPAPDHPFTVLDLGGGTGGLAVRIAGLGHHVTVVDPSPDALAALERRAAEAGVAATVRGILGDARSLLDVVGKETADLVVCHGVLEVVEDPGQALRAVAAALRPGGHLSLVAAQRSGAVLTRALAGDFSDARAALEEPGPQTLPPRRFSRADLEALVSAAGLDPVRLHGVRVFADHVSGGLVDAEPGLAAQLLELEAAVCDHDDYMPMATQLHLLGRKRH